MPELPDRSSTSPTSKSMWGDIDFGNNRLAIDVRDVDRRAFGASIDVVDVDRSLQEPESRPERADFDVVHIDRRTFAAGIDVADVEIDVG